MNVKNWGTTKNKKIKQRKFWKKVYPLSKVFPQARTEGRKEPVVLQWDPWEGHLQVTNKIIVAVNLVVVIVVMVVVVDVVVGRAIAGDHHHLHRHHHCCRLPPSSSLSSMLSPPDDYMSLQTPQPDFFPISALWQKLIKKNRLRREAISRKRTQVWGRRLSRLIKITCCTKCRQSAHRVFLSRWTSWTCEPRRMWSASLGESRGALSESLQRVRRMPRRWPRSQL